MGIEITISNSRVPGFGKGVRSVPGQAIGPDRSTSLSDRPMTREKCSMICQFLKSFVRGALAVCVSLVWLAVRWVKRIGVTQRRSTKGFYQAIEGFGTPTPMSWQTKGHHFT